MRTTLAAFAALLLVLAGCTGVTSADVEADPSGALRDAIEAIADYEGIELQISASGDADALAAETGEDREDLELLLDSRLVLIATGESEEDAQFELRVDLGGTDVFELRVLPGSRLFLRADLEGFAVAVDDPSLTADLDDLVVTAREFGLGDVAEAALSGRWIELTGVEELIDFAEDFGGAMGTPEEPSEDELEELQQQLVAALERFVDEDLTVDYVGSEDAGERVRATATGPALQRLFSDIVTIAADAGGVDPALLGDVEGEIPADLELSIDVWLDGGEISQFGLDLAELDDQGEVPAGTFLLIGLAEFTGEVQEPADAEPFDLFGLISGVLFGGFGDLGGGFDTGLDEDLGDFDDFEDFDDLEVECVPQDEVDEFDLQELVDAGFLEVC